MHRAIPSIFTINCYSAIKLGISSIFTFFMAYYQSAPDALRNLWIWLIILFVTDTVLGLSHAVICGKLSSNGLRSGASKFLSYMALILVGASIDCMMRVPYIVANIITGYIILTETVSIIENVRKLGIPVPTFLDKLINRIMETIEHSAESICNTEDEGNGDSVNG